MLDEIVLEILNHLGINFENKEVYVLIRYF